MKYKKKWLLLLLGVLLWSCTGDEVQELPSQAQDTSIDLKTTVADPTGEVSDPFYLENYSQWAAFTTSWLLRYSPEAQSLFQHNMSAENTVSFDDVFGPAISEPGYNFAADFKSRLAQYINCCPDPDTEDEKPPPPPPGDPPFGGGDPTTEEIVNNIVDYLVFDNCMEFYFPNGLNFNYKTFSITSTAHPLTTVESNNGILRIYDPIVDEDYPLGISTFPKTVDDAYAFEGHMIIMARPYRINTGPIAHPCYYTEYPDVDFTLFLD